MTKMNVVIMVGLLLASTPMWAQADPGAQRQGDQATQTWTGTLVDADCKAAVPRMVCTITASTKSFGLQTADGKFAKLDNDGNEKVRNALESSGKMSGRVRASVSGSLEGDIIKAVDAVKVH
jgi:hypothetical protein